MTQDKTRIDGLWQRVAEGRHAAALGIAIGDPPASIGLHVVRVSCDVPLSTLGPLIDARRKVEQILGGSPALLDQARQMVVSGLRRRLLGDAPAGDGADGAIVETLNRLARQEGRRSALLFDAVESADEATLDALRQMIVRSGWLELPIILSFRTLEPSGRAAALLDALRSVEGPDAVVSAAGEARPEDALDARAHKERFPSLPSDVLRVLRAGACVGSGFEAELVAALLRLDPLDVLEALQRAADAGVPIEDRGEGRFHLPEPLLAALRASLLPSIGRAWHRRLAALLSGEESARVFAAAPRPSADPEASAEPAAKPAAAAAPEHVESDARGSEPSEPSAAASAAGEAATAGAAEASAPARAEEPSAFSEAERGEEESEKRGERVERDERDERDEREIRETAGAGAPWPYAEIFARAAEAAAAETSPSGESAASAAAPANDAEPSNAIDDEANTTHKGASEGPDLGAPPAGGWINPFAVPSSMDEDDARSGSPGAPFDSDRSIAARDEASGAREPAPRRTSRREVEGPLADMWPARARSSDPPRASRSAARDEARAAGHLSAAGETEAAVERYAAAVNEAAAVGAYAQAVVHARRALSLLEELPVSPRRRRMRAQVLTDLGRLQWLAAGPDLTFTLAGALEVLEAARASLTEDDPPAQRAEVAVLIAGVCYDVGDMRSLVRALDELTFASRILLGAGDSVGAARLLNDQAAVYVRMGDPVRATHLLSESRKIFEKMAPTDPVAMIELAETDHLFARIPLHVAARPGREQDALSMGLDHALACERTYRKLGASRELGRVWETMGRLELKKGRLKRAADRLTAALELQQSIGDLLGLARTTAVLSEVLAAGGRFRDALALLGDSIALNMEKGSPIGLAFNRRALDTLAQSLPPGGNFRGMLEQVASRLSAAESRLGRVKLPGERD